jgi:hypothetical protein
MAQFRTGEDARADIDDIPYSFKRFRLTKRQPRLEVGNSEGKAGNPAILDEDPGYDAAVRGLRRMDITVEEATFDEESTIFGVPHTVAQHTYISNLRIYPNGRDGDYHYFPSAFVEEVTHEGEVGGLQPVSFTASSDGKFFLYGEPKP